MQIVINIFSFIWHIENGFKRDDGKIKGFNIRLILLLNFGWVWHFCGLKVHDINLNKQEQNRSKAPWISAFPQRISIKPQKVSNTRKQYENCFSCTVFSIGGRPGCRFSKFDKRNRFLGWKTHRVKRFSTGVEQILKVENSRRLNLGPRVLTIFKLFTFKGRAEQPDNLR